MVELANFIFKKTKKNPTLECLDCEYELPFYKDVEYFSSLENYVAFVKSVERIVRSSVYYSRYVAYIKGDIGLNKCQVLSNIEDEPDSKTQMLEMHHGPILNLFDIVAIIVDYMLYHNKKINTFNVARIVIDEHYKNNVQVVMLSKTVHQEVHARNIFINVKQAFGNINTFLLKYKDGLSKEHIDKINNYIELSKKYDSFDKDILTLENNVKKWSDQIDFY